MSKFLIIPASPILEFSLKILIRSHI